MLRNDNYVTRGLELARRLNYRRPELWTLASFYHQGLLTGSQRELLLRMLAPVHALAREQPELALFDVPQSLGGELEVGGLPTGNPMKLPLAQLATGTLVIGTTGSGKTTLLLSIVDEICALSGKHEERVGLWVADHQKADMEASISLAKRHGLRMAIAPQDFLFNPLEPPPRVPARTWTAKAHSIITFALQLPETTALYLRPILSELYARIHCPTWNELIQAVQDTENVPETVRRPLCLKLEGIAADMPGLASTRHGFPIQEVEQRMIYWPLYRLPRDHARLLYAWARWASYTRRIENRQNRHRPDLIVVEDEISFAYNETSGNDFISMLCAVQRSTGTAFIGANQTFDILPQILANTNLKLIGRLASMPDVRTASDLLTLTSEQRDWLLTHPQPGQFLAKLPSGHVQPFPFRARQPEIRTLNPQERDQAEQVLHEELDQFVVKAEAETAHESELVPSAPEPNKSPSDDEQALLESCYAQPFVFHTQRARLCGFNNNRMNRLKKFLLAKGLVVEHELETCRPGARPKLLEITEEGCRSLSKPIPAWKGRLGGFLHHYGKELARAHYEDLGFAVSLEAPLGNGLSVDTFAVQGAEQVAVEVQVEEDHAVENLRKLEGRVTRVEFLCFTAPIKKRLENLVKGRPGVGVHHFSWYLKDLHQFESGLPSLSRAGNDAPTTSVRGLLT